MATNRKLTDALKGKTVDSVRQRDQEVDIDFEDGYTLSFRLHAAEGNLSLDDDDGNTVYDEDDA